MYGALDQVLKISPTCTVQVYMYLTQNYRSTGFRIACPVCMGVHRSQPAETKILEFILWCKKSDIH